jgi:hypothetical protein
MQIYDHLNQIIESCRLGQSTRIRATYIYSEGVTTTTVQIALMIKAQTKALIWLSQ